MGKAPFFMSFLSLSLCLLIFPFIFSLDIQTYHIPILLIEKSRFLYKIGHHKMKRKTIRKNILNVVM